MTVDTTSEFLRLSLFASRHRAFMVDKVLQIRGLQGIELDSCA